MSTQTVISNYAQSNYDSVILVSDDEESQLITTSSKVLKTLGASWTKIIQYTKVVYCKNMTSDEIKDLNKKKN